MTWQRWVFPPPSPKYIELKEEVSYFLVQCNVFFMSQTGSGAMKRKERGMNWKTAEEKEVAGGRMRK